MKYIHTLLLSLIIAFCISTTVYAEDVMFDEPVQFGPGFFQEYKDLSVDDLIFNTKGTVVLGFRKPIEEIPTIEPLTAENVTVIETLEVSPSKNRWDIELNDNEKYILAQIVTLESGNQSDLGQQAIVEVICNRVTSSNFPNDVVSVLSQKKQFSTWKYKNKAQVTNKELVNIDTVLNGETNIFPAKTVFFSRGAQNERIQAIIGDHVFCNEK